MAETTLLRRVEDRLPSPLGGALEIGTAMVADAASLLTGSAAESPLDEWDPEYIRRTLPLLRRLFGTYFRADVHGMENIPADGPALLVGNHSGGLMIADTFVFGFEFYDDSGPSGDSISWRMTS